MNEPSRPAPGTSVAQYVVGELIAKGGMASVYEAVDSRDGRPVALKILRGALQYNDEAIARLELEHQTAAMFRSRYVVRVFEHGSVSGAHYLAMERLHGELLRVRLERLGMLEVPTLLRFVAQLAEALSEAHALGVVHRDIKPDNIFVCQGEDGDEVRLLDFGAVKLQISTGAKLTATGMTLGSPEYMSPEQIKGLADLDPRSDVFSLALVVHQMACETHPFAGRTLQDVLQNILHESPLAVAKVRDDLPAAVDAVLGRALQKDKSQRYPSVAEFVADFFQAFGVAGDWQGLAKLSDADMANLLPRHSIWSRVSRALGGSGWGYRPRS